MALDAREKRHGDAREQSGNGFLQCAILPNRQGLQRPYVQEREHHGVAGRDFENYHVSSIERLIDYSSIPLTAFDVRTKDEKLAKNPRAHQSPSREALYVWTIEGCPSQDRERCRRRHSFPEDSGT
jgi:hypothetical protein